ADQPCLVWRVVEHGLVDVHDHCGLQAGGGAGVVTFGRDQCVPVGLGQCGVEGIGRGAVDGFGAGAVFRRGLDPEHGVEVVVRDRAAWLRRRRIGRRGFGLRRDAVRRGERGGLAGRQQQRGGEQGGGGYQGAHGGPGSTGGRRV